MGAAQPDEKKPTVFVRESTGLVKNVSFIDSIALNFSNMSVGPLLTTIAGSSAATLLFANVAGLNLVVASMIAFGLSIPQIVIYTMMSRRYPRAGGDYVWLSRNFGGFAGSTLSFWGYTMETLAFIALVVILLDYSIGGVGAEMGFAYGFPTASWTVLFGAGFWQFVVGGLAFTIVIALNILKPKAGYKFVTVLAVFGAVTLVIAIAVLLVGGHSALVNYANGTGPYAGANNIALNGTSSYTAVSSTYQSSGMPFDLNFGNMLYIMPVMFAFVYPWLNAGPAVASEMKGSRALKWNVPVSAIITFVFATSTFAVLYYVGGLPYINGLFHDYAYQSTIGPNFFSMAMGIANNPWVAWVIGLGWVALQFAVIAYAVIIFSRYMLAQSLDRFLPSRLSYVSPRFGSPMVAMLIDWVITIALVGVTAYYYGTIFGIFGAIIASMVYFMFVGLAAVVHAVRKESGLSKGLLSLAGFLNVLVFGYVAYLFLANPGFTGLNNVTYAYSIGTLVAGALIYLTSSWYHKKRGMDISINYKELPPE
ncbi:MAG: APC family permease [Nitrososphaerota archaeon]|jgi:amino acid transporter|nr:APC family permease [Nitrososphaerota archaeon]MDG6941514.1 APC family permease [Nitrososphaerota archaeon]MDG6951055.1 APC family permease [Nitrososphaerota archaeon]